MAVDFALDAGIATITINRPEARNALDVENYVALARCWERVRDDPDVLVAIITGVGTSFCAGADLKTLIPVATDPAFLTGGNREQMLPARDVQTGVLRQFPLDKPIIAAVNGHCVASGMEMLLGTDIRIAAQSARFGLPEVCRGLFASGGSTVRLPRQIPFVHAMDILLTCRYLSADEALAMGLVNRVVPDGELMDAALDYARRIAANAPYAVQQTKRAVMDGMALDREAAFALESRIGDAVFGHPDAQEGPRAFIEKRTPIWQATVTDVVPSE
ncbi:crotonase/enoyl-CoA hydratase family protein [soil metagenome]